MRRKERIPIVMDAIVGTDVILNRWLKESGCKTTSYSRKTIKNNSWRIYKYWMENPDLRFGQMLFNIGFTPDGLYQEEATEWLVNNDFLRKQDVTFWGTFGLTEDQLKLREQAIANMKPRYKDVSRYLSKKDKAKEYAVAYYNWRIDYYDTLKHTYKPISELNDNHIDMILNGPRKIGNTAHRKLFEEEVAFRKEMK